MPAQADSWVPLEGTPSIFTDFVTKLAGKKVGKFVDIWSMDEDSLSQLPALKALVFVMPLSEAQKKFESKDAEYKGQCWYTKQMVPNACGTVAAMHALANLDIEMSPDSIFGKFFEKCKNKTPSERAKLLMSEPDIRSAHEAADASSQTAVDSSEECHYICISNIKGDVVELDGGREWPISRGTASSDAEFAVAVSKVVKEYMARDPKELRFSMLGFTIEQ
eukprot:Filipodium_phascolosomae@DN2184_c0_g1_i1.p1